MNEVRLIGNLATDPDMQATKNDVRVCTFRLAVRRTYKSKENGERKSDFFTIVAWRQLGELCKKYLSKGKKVAVIGHLEPKNYEGKDGSKRYTIDVVADDIEFLSPRTEEYSGNSPDHELRQAGGDYGLLPDDEQTPF